ncbi:MAG: divalent-cation tolerance protein CutA [Candidatus Margulisbacteria bacterium]|nr:divalent-cation tolerance protein CutA [Candidatus Margulisiibacteriota bacterium]
MDLAARINDHGFFGWLIPGNITVGSDRPDFKNLEIHGLIIADFFSLPLGEVLGVRVINKHYLVYITTKDKDEAKEIGLQLVKGRLAAGVNIIEKIDSIYWWEGKIRNNAEALLIAKTNEPVVTALIEMVKSLHSYKTPCIVSLPINEGNPDFLKWIDNEVPSNRDV